MFRAQFIALPSILCPIPVQQFVMDRRNFLSSLSFPSSPISLSYSSILPLPPLFSFPPPSPPSPPFHFLYVSQHCLLFPPKTRHLHCSFQIFQTLVERSTFICWCVVICISHSFLPSSPFLPPLSSPFLPPLSSPFLPPLSCPLSIYAIYPSHTLAPAAMMMWSFTKEQGKADVPVQMKL